MAHCIKPDRTRAAVDGTLSQNTLFYLRPLPWGQGHTKCRPVSSTSATYASAKFEVATSDGLEDAFTSKYMISNDIDLRVKATQNVAQYFQNHMTYAPAKFDVATGNRLGEDTSTRKYIT